MEALGTYPTYRSRRMRQNDAMRALVRETSLAVGDFIYPLFVKPGKGIKEVIDSMPGVYRYSIDMLAPEIDELKSLGIKCVLLFGLPEHKDALGSEGYNDEGIVQQAVRFIKGYDKDMTIITDVCLCEYTDHGHCGVLEEDGYVQNDKTLELLCAEALSHARAGAHMVAPSDMMDGHTQAIRKALDEAGFVNVGIMAYSAKYSSGFYGPFREAADSAPSFGDRRAYQMDPANQTEGVRAAAMDIAAGADLVMVKPAMAYLDVLRRIHDELEFPCVAYNVSGEYSMVKAAAANGWIDEKRVVLELLLSIKRAGACAIITYHAKDAARWLKD